MKKHFCLLLILVLSAFSSLNIAYANEDTRFSFDSHDYDMVNISYSHGQGFLYLLTRPNYNYLTTDTEAIKNIVDCLNSFSVSPSDSSGTSSDGIYLTVSLRGQKTDTIHFDLLPMTAHHSGIDAAYSFTADDYNRLTDLIYSLKYKDSIKIYFDNTELKPDIAPQMESGRTLIPAQPLADAMGADVIWDIENSSVTISKDGISVCCEADKDYIVVNDNNVPVDIGAKIYDHALLLPIRSVCEAFGYTVDWENNSVYINSSLDNK